MEPKDNPELTEVLRLLRSEIKSLRAEMSRVQETVLRERVRSIQESLSKNHLLLYTDQSARKLSIELDEMLRPNCESKENCLSKCRGILDSNMAAVQKSADAAITDLESKIKENQQMIEKTKGHTCEGCFRNFDKILKREHRAYKEIILVQSVSKAASDDVLNIPLLMDSILEPLASDVRLKILDSVYQGKKSFSQLSKTLDLKAGHFAFHLRKLTAANLITQEVSKGDYVITEKGLRIIKRVLTLQNEEQKRLEQS